MTTRLQIHSTSRERFSINSLTVITNSDWNDFEATDDWNFLIKIISNSSPNVNQQKFPLLDYRKSWEKTFFALLPRTWNKAHQKIMQIANDRKKIFTHFHHFRALVIKFNISSKSLKGFLIFHPSRHERKFIFIILLEEKVPCWWRGAPSVWFVAYFTGESGMREKRVVLCRVPPLLMDRTQLPSWKMKTE